jgi:hypothetical protein
VIAVSDHPQTWHIHHAAVCVGLIAERSGIDHAAEPWEWHSGFYPGSPAGRSALQHRAASFDAARAAIQGGMAGISA